MDGASTKPGIPSRLAQAVGGGLLNALVGAAVTVALSLAAACGGGTSESPSSDAGGGQTESNKAPPPPAEGVYFPEVRQEGA